MRHVAITGASGGIGRELALRFAKNGDRLSINSRDKNKLDNLKNELESLTLEVETYAFDVRDLQACKEWLENVFKNRVDILIINAGIGLKDDRSPAAHINLVQTNVLGVANIIFHAMQKMNIQDNKGGYRGQIVLIASIASLLAMPNASSYSASKAFVRTLGEALSIAQDDIAITTIAPGFIRTNLTSHLPSYILMLSLESATDKIMNAIECKKRLSIFPLWLSILARFYNILPFFIKLRLRKVFTKLGSL